MHKFSIGYKFVFYNFFLVKSFLKDLASIGQESSHYTTINLVYSKVTKSKMKLQIQAMS
jgi:hypothetical protein